MNRITEKEVSRIWQDQLLNGERLTTEDGLPLQVIYPGRLNNDRGADFQEAVIVTGRELLKGDVELHVRASDWQTHGHHLDAAYNRVILHVVFWDDTGLASRLENGRAVPTLALEKWVSDPLKETPVSVLPEGHIDPACVRVAQQPDGNIAAGELLDKAGDERFRMKAGRFGQDLARVWAGQALYEGVMGALGYSCNKLPFLELARRLPLRFLGESGTHDNSRDAHWLLQRQALLLGTAGLLPMLREGCYRDRFGGEWLAELERLWTDSPPTRVMSPDDWHLVPVRPNNSPVLRLLALSELLRRYREPGWLEGLTGLVREAPLSRSGHKHLEAGFVVTVDGVPSGGSQSQSTKRLSLLGGQRAADIVVNVLLPFTYAWSWSIAQPGLGDKALELYRLYPRLATNSIEELMIQRLRLDRKLVDSARRQQGLLHIHNNFCETGRCGECPLRQPKAGHHV